MTHLTYLTWVAYVDFCFFIVVCVWRWVSVSSKLWNGRMDGEMKMQNCGYFAKWWNGGGGNWCFMVDGGCTYSHQLSSRDCSNHTLSKISLVMIMHVTLRVDQNSATIVHAYLKNLPLPNHNWCSMVMAMMVATNSRQCLPVISWMGHCRCQKTSPAMTR